MKRLTPQEPCRYGFRHGLLGAGRIHSEQRASAIRDHRVANFCGLEHLRSGNNVYLSAPGVGPPGETKSPHRRCFKAPGRTYNLPATIPVFEFAGFVCTNRLNRHLFLAELALLRCFEQNRRLDCERPQARATLGIRPK